MNAREIRTTSEIKELVIFSGGGGIMRRTAALSLREGQHLIKLDGVPVSFAPNTLDVSITPNNFNKILQFTTKKPTRTYIEEQLRKEAAAAREVIKDSVNIGTKRSEIIKAAEEVIKRDYLDEQAEISLFVETTQDNEATIEYSFIIQDRRLRWSPFITINLLEGGEAQIQCLLTIENNTALNLEDVEVKFAEFDLPPLSDLADILVEHERHEQSALPPPSPESEEIHYKKQLIRAAKMLF